MTSQEALLKLQVMTLSCILALQVQSPLTSRLGALETAFKKAELERKQAAQETALKFSHRDKVSMLCEALAYSFGLYVIQPLHNCLHEAIKTV